jgi:hypothetical protein
MKHVAIFVLYFSLGVFLIFSYKKINQILNSQQLKTPLAESAFSLNSAPSESLKGTIVFLSGDVSWQSRIATEASLISKPMQIQQGEEIVTKENGQAVVVFSNIANIVISPKTNVNFIQTLPNNILIGQNSGTVDYKKLGDNPLSVRSQDLLIKINQGEISVSVSEKQPYITVDVKEGSITVGYNDLSFLTKVVDVAANKRLIFRTDTKRISVASL